MAVDQHGLSSFPQDHVDPIESVQNAILQRMKQQHEHDRSRMFICEHDLKAVWEDHNLTDIFPSESWTKSELRVVRTNLLKILSIVIWINWPFLRERFRSVFFSRLHQGIRDDDLPFSLDMVAGLGYSRHMFYQEQFAFIPAVIEEHEETYIQVIPREIRLPFREKSAEIGSGGYGEVKKVEIAPRCLFNVARKSDSPVAVAIACKLYKNDRSKEDFQKELDNLDFLKESLLRQDRIMLHIAAIVHGTDFMILLPLAEHRDLEVLLNCGFDCSMDSRYPEKLYDFDTEFPNLTENSLHGAIFQELSALASALKWLHDDLIVLGSPDLYCAHMDLKPKNILIKHDPQSLIGKWVISDFGISAFDKATNMKETRFQSIRDTGPRVTSRAPQEVERGHGPFQPPEIHNSGSVDARKSDVWSFGCVSCEVMAFAIGKREAVSDFRDRRFHNSRDDYFYEQAKRLTLDTTGISGFQLNQGVTKWFDELLVQPKYVWVPEFVEILQKVLVVEPHGRPDARDMWKELEQLSHSIAPWTRRGTDRGAQSPAVSTPHLLKGDDGGRPDSPVIPTGLSLNIARLNFRSNSDTPSFGSPSKTPIGSPSERSAFNYSSNSTQSSQTLPPQFTPLFQDSASVKLSDYDIPSSTNGDSYSQDVSMRRRVGSWGPSLADSSNSGMPWASMSTRSSSSHDAGEIISSPLVSLPLMPGKKILDMALSPSGYRAVFLYGQSAHVFNIGKKGFENSSIVQLPMATWTKISIASHYLAVYGIGPPPQRAKKLFVCNLRHMSRTIKIPSSFDSSQVANVAVSSRGTVAFICMKQIGLLHLQRDDSMDKEETITIAPGYVINQAAFSADGRWLCAWAIGSGADQSYYWDLESSPARPLGIGHYSKVRTASTDFKILPFGSSPSSVIRERHGHVFITQPSSYATCNIADTPSIPPKVQIRQAIGITDALVACVAENASLVCVEKAKMGRKPHLNEYTFMQKRDGTVAVAEKPIKLASLKTGVDERTTKAAIITTAAEQTIVICTIKGEIEKFTRTV